MHRWSNRASTAKQDSNQINNNNNNNSNSNSNNNNNNSNNHSNNSNNIVCALCVHRWSNRASTAKQDSNQINNNNNNNDNDNNNNNNNNNNSNNSNNIVCARAQVVKQMLNSRKTYGSSTDDMSLYLYKKTQCLPLPCHARFYLCPLSNVTCPSNST